MATMKPLHRSATSEMRILVEQARDEAYVEGMERRAELDIAGLEANGFKEAAAWLRAAQLVVRERGE